MDELVRLGVAALLGGVIVAAACGARALYFRRLAGHAEAPADDLLARYDLPAGEPGILYFAGERCVQCVALQEPALKRLASVHPVNIRKLDAVGEPDITRRFNILTVPATVVIGADQRIRSVNVGFADERTLLQQLA